MDEKRSKKEFHHKLNGKRVALIPVTVADMDFLYHEESNPELWRYEEYVETDRQRIIDKFTKRIDDDRVFDFIVKRICDGEAIGVVYIWKCNESRRSWEIGYIILPQFQGNGYCLESVNLLIAFAFGELNAHKVLGMCNCENIRSAMVMQRAGMSKQGVFREEYQCHGKWVDQFYFSILKREYGLR